MFEGGLQGLPGILPRSWNSGAEVDRGRVSDRVPEKVSLKSVGKGRYTMDARGFTCPYPELFARRALEALGPGDVLEFMIDNVPSCETVPAAAEELGHKVLEVAKVDEATWRIVIQKR
jgi:tRNA 2-thiouridine synthesizing protein A